MELDASVRAQLFQNLGIDALEIPNRLDSRLGENAAYVCMLLGMAIDPVHYSVLLLHMYILYLINI